MGKPSAKRYFIENKDSSKKDNISKARSVATESGQTAMHTEMSTVATESGQTAMHTEMSTAKHDIEKQTSTKKRIRPDSISHDLSKVDFNEIKFSRRKRTGDFSSSKQRQPSMRERVDPFPGDAPIDKKKIQKYRRGRKMDVMTVKTGYHRHQFEMKEKKLSFATKQAARTELLLQEDAGFLEADEGEHTSEVSQGEIAEAVDINSAQKYFELKLDKFGPYRINYTRNGRFLLIGGGRGHVAAIDWQTKKLLCEINAMETCYDAKWLHFETMFAVAQKQWTYIYDNQGVELHCLKVLDRVLRLEFLPYHFLLASASASGYLNYLDVSIGKKVAGFHTDLGRLDVMCQNPQNGIIHLGHSGGTVTMWSPNVKRPLVKMLCHGSGTRSIAVDQSGQYMATSGIDRTMKLWDLRTFNLLHSYKIGAGANNLAFSARRLLAAGVGNVVQIYKDTCRGTVSEPYLTHRPGATVHGLQFCPYEDVLGVGHGKGFSSLLVPGAGEPNFDALEANPFQTKKQRQHAEVHMLLEKVQPDMIAMDTSALGKVDKKTIMETMEEKKELLYLKPKKIDFEPKYKKKGRSKSGKVEKRKKGVQLENQRDQIREFQQKKMAKRKTHQKKPNASGGHRYNVFERFKQKQD